MVQFDSTTDYSLLKNQEEYWYKEVMDIMTSQKLEMFPTMEQFKKADKVHILNDIQQNCGLVLFADLYGIDHIQFHYWKNIVFDLMDKRYLTHYPEKSHWVAMGKKVCYHKIENTIGHEVLKERFTLLSRDEYLRKVGK